MSLFSALALACVAAGLAMPLLTSVIARAPRAGLAMMMELWTAAGLLRLADNPSWRAISAAATVIGIRKLVLLGLSQRRAQV